MNALLLRSWRPFLDYRLFAFPRSFGDLKLRISRNTEFFAANYAFFGAFLCLVECLIYHPFLIFISCVGFLFAMYYSFSHLPLHVGTTQITPMHKSLAMTIVGLLAMYLTGSARPLLYVSFAWISFTLLHSAFRPWAGEESTASITSPSSLPGSGRRLQSPADRASSSSSLTGSGRRLQPPPETASSSPSMAGSGRRLQPPTESGL